MQLVKVQYYNEDARLSDLSYTYYSEEPLKVGDMVTVPMRNRTGKARVSAIDVPEAEIQAFRNKVKVIPAGSVVQPTVPEDKPDDESRTPVEKVVDVSPFGVETYSGPALITDEMAVVTIKVKPEDDPNVIALATEVRKLRDFAVARIIGADSDLKPATEDLSVIAKVKKALTEAKALYVKPIRGYLEDVNAAFTSITAPLDEADKVTRDKILAYREVQRKKATEAEAINQAKADLARREAQFNGTGEVTIDTTPVEAPAPIRRVSTDLGTAGVVRNLTWELVDFATVPDQYKVLDAGKITKLVKAGGTIPGIRVIEGETLRVTTRK